MVPPEDNPDNRRRFGRRAARASGPDSEWNQTPAGSPVPGRILTVEDRCWQCRSKVRAIVGVLVDPAVTGDRDGFLAFEAVGPPRCSYSLGSASVFVQTAGTEGMMSVLANYSQCSWIAASTVNWIVVTAGYGTGNGALTYIVLLRAFRSLVLPLKALFLNALSVAAVYGLLALVWGEVEGWIPVFLFAVIFGLSMDYEVFLVTRMRESWDRGADNARAVAHGLESTGRIVTAAALIMVAAFSGFAAGRVEPLQQFGVALALAVLIDATIVRAVLLPAAMAVLGRWNWWLPERVARLARVEASPLRREKE